MFHTHTVATTTVPMPNGTMVTVRNIHDLAGIEDSYEEEINKLWIAAVSPGDKTNTEMKLQGLRNSMEQLAKQSYDIMESAIQLMFVRLLDMESALHEIAKIETQACALRHEKAQLGSDKMSQIRKQEIRMMLQRARRNISYYKRKIEAEEHKHEIETMRNTIKMYH